MSLSIHLQNEDASSSYLVLLFHAMQEEAELGVVMDNMSAGQELLRQKEDRLKVLENALLGGLVSNNHSNHSPRCAKIWLSVFSSIVTTQYWPPRPEAKTGPMGWQASPFSPATFSL